jgi:hypothetical protein
MTGNENVRHQSRIGRLLLSRQRKWTAAAAAVAVTGTGLFAGLAVSQAVTSNAHGVTGVPGGGPGNARSAPAAGGAVGTVSALSGSSFTLTTPAAQRVTVHELPSATVPVEGESVLVLGTTSGTTITDASVIAQPATGSGSATTSTSVVPFQRGAPAASKQVGQIPANYTEGSGTITSGAAAISATEAALSAYAGGVVDRVVKLSNGEYEVHNIGVNWPHHIFVSQSFQVVGAD